MGDLNTELVKVEMQELAELYHFETPANVLPGQAPGHHEYVAKSTQPITFQGVTYTPVPITRNTIRDEHDFRPISLDVTTQITEVFRSYLASTPTPQILLTMYRVLTYDPDNFWQLIFRGWCKGISVEDQAATGHFIGGAAVFRQKVPLYVYQAHCNNVLFDTRCGLNKEDYLVLSTPIYDGRDLVDTVFAAYDDGYFSGGFVERTDVYDVRLIINHVADRITLQNQFVSPFSTNVRVFPGCDKDIDTCKEKFDNQQHFLGFPFIRSTNPVVFGIVLH